MPQKDKDLLEKTQNLLSQSKLYELERTHLNIDRKSPDREESAAIKIAQE